MSAGSKRRANPLRGEASLMIDGTAYTLRPSFDALVAAELELGPLFAVVERAGEGRLSLNDMMVLFWYCLREKDGLTPEKLGEAILQQGLANCLPALRIVLAQICQGGR
ncbi:gene transfer agent family protein [Altericroceibacterium endophyticum]|uniref:Gene transfer agent family protein n=1 Tax=Altericroceibacterium endophyticum TaxID=1808508 RepID=A0A6I4T3L9_9SPHN|nr:gene transfer agent family protein [Altericroceibacterium endophyticum]MXO65497.1 gene transfer agent family protein [Altericroceibacterium endophyticum]